MEVLEKPCPSLSQARLASQVVEPQHKIYFVIRNLAHDAVSRLNFAVSGFAASRGDEEALESSTRCITESGNPWR